MGSEEGDSMTAQNAIIHVKDLEKTFDVGKGKVDVLKKIDLEIYPGEFVIIFGPSGCGKSTLLNSIVGLERPTKGEVVVKHQNFYEMNADQRAKFRSDNFGIIYQQSNWVKSLNVVENVAFPLSIRGISERKGIREAKELLELFRLEDFAKNIPTELSGGQQQRVSVTRALITNPAVLIADEPTGNLDSVSAADMMYVLEFLNTESKRTIIMVTHNPEYERYATKIVRMEDGKIKKVEVKKEVHVSASEKLPDILPPDEGGEK
jgi:putative ABC transport system ATP-binding protein